MSTFNKYFVAANVPTTAAGFADDNFSVVDMRRGRRQFAIGSSAVTALPQGLVNPDFDTLNITDEPELADIIVRTAEAAGLANRKRWSIALPDSAARTLVVSLESRPSSRNELREVLEWKIERVIAVPPAQLRISRQRITPYGGHERYLCTVARDEVVAQYESVFQNIGWKAGLMLPRHMGEAQWLIWDETPGDKMLVSGNRHGFTSLVARDGEPILVRTFVCDAAARGDELHRFALYYRDRLTDGASSGSKLNRLLLLGGFDSREATSALNDALDAQPGVIEPAEFGMDLTGESILFDHLAGAAGLATIAWR